MCYYQRNPPSVFSLSPYDNAHDLTVEYHRALFCHNTLVDSRQTDTHDKLHILTIAERLKTKTAVVETQIL